MFGEGEEDGGEGRVWGRGRGGELHGHSNLTVFDPQERVDEWMTDLVRNMSLKDETAPGVVESVCVNPLNQPNNKSSSGNKQQCLDPPPLLPRNFIC